MSKEWTSDKSYIMVDEGRMPEQSWRQFIDAFYVANSDTPLPPKDKVSRIYIDIEAGESHPVVTFVVLGLNLPGHQNPVTGENGVP